MHIFAKSNQYADVLGKMIDQIPKSVLAAIAVSALTTGGEHLQEARQRVANEWLILWANGIVPQKPPRDVRRLALTETSA